MLLTIPSGDVIIFPSVSNISLVYIRIAIANFADKSWSFMWALMPAAPPQWENIGSPFRESKTTNSLSIPQLAALNKTLQSLSFHGHEEKGIQTIKSLQALFCYRDTTNSNVHDLLVVEGYTSVERSIWDAIAFYMHIYFLSSCRSSSWAHLTNPELHNRIGASSTFVSETLCYSQNFEQFLLKRAAKSVILLYSSLGCVLLFHTRYVYVSLCHSHFVKCFRLGDVHASRSSHIVPFWGEPMHIYI